jgi:hypothetical protein
VILSAASTTLCRRSQSTRAAVISCIAAVVGVNDRMAAIATVLSVNE